MGILDEYEPPAHLRFTPPAYRSKDAAMTEDSLKRLNNLGRKKVSEDSLKRLNNLGRKKVSEDSLKRLNNLGRKKVSEDFSDMPTPQERIDSSRTNHANN